MTVIGTITYASHPPLAHAPNRPNEQLVEVRVQREDRKPDIRQHVSSEALPAFRRLRDFVGERYEFTLDEDGTIVGATWLPKP